MNNITETLLETVEALPEDKQQEVLDFAAFLQTRTEAGNKTEAVSPAPQPKIPLPPEPEQPPLAALMQEWIREGENATDEEIRAAEAELEELKRSMNADRAEAGERLLFV